MMNCRNVVALGLLAFASSTSWAQASEQVLNSNPNPFLSLMMKARTHAEAHGAKIAPVLSPNDATLIGPNPSVNVAALHKAGFRVDPWTTNDPEKMRALIALRVDGIISDRPD